MSTPIAALEAALYSRDQPDTRKTYGKVEFALIPVAVIEAVLDADAIILDEPTDRTEAPEPITAAEVAVVVEPVDPLAAFPEDTTIEVAGPSPDGFPDDEAGGEVAAASDNKGDEEE